MLKNKCERLINQIENIEKSSIAIFYNDLKRIVEETNINSSSATFIDGTIIDYGKYLKEKNNKESYDILEKYNYIEKLKLVKYASIIGMDKFDVVTFFNDGKIVKIIDGDDLLCQYEGLEKIFIIFTAK